MAQLEIKQWNPDHFTPNSKSAQRCTWGGSTVDDPCPEPPEFTVTDRRGTRWAACPTHLLSHVRDRVKNET